MSRQWQQDVFEFMEKFSQFAPCDPCLPDEATRKLRKQLILQETLETIGALDRGDLPEIIDGVIDLIYVALGTAVSCGVNIQPIWDKVHGANMMKMPYSTERAFELEMAGAKGIVPGKVLKPIGWRPVNIARCIEQQMRLKQTRDIVESVNE